MRQIVLDTETTGLDPLKRHRIIEIGCVELVDRQLTGRHYHQYINPQRKIDEGALEVHGISTEFLADKPLFADIAQDFLDFIEGAELIIHNAPFDVGFINHEFLPLKNFKSLPYYCNVVDTLVLARKMHPGKRNSLDALCSRYDIDNSKRDLHGALLDAEILAQVYLMMTGGQSSFFTDDQSTSNNQVQEEQFAPLSYDDLKVIQANPNELAAHDEYLKKLGEACVWKVSELETVE